MLCFPNCKINIGLYITAKRPDGYHDIETVFYPLPVTDVLEAVPATMPQLHMSGRAVAGNINDNLVWKAYQLMRSLYRQQIQPMDIYLHKVLPMGAGLGGGSADGAYMLRLLNDYCQLNISDAQLAEMALQLGSDCPFFIYNSPQYAQGRGEQMTPVAIDLSGYSIQVLCPAVHVSTKEAFAGISPKAAPYDLKQLPGLPVAEWKQHIGNDFEEGIFSMHPELGMLKEALYAQGALYAAMSGSGSAVYGIMPKGQRAVIESTVNVETMYVE